MARELLYLFYFHNQSPPSYTRLFCVDEKGQKVRKSFAGPQVLGNWIRYQREYKVDYGIAAPSDQLTELVRKLYSNSNDISPATKEQVGEVNAFASSISKD